MTRHFLCLRSLAPVLLLSLLPGLRCAAAQTPTPRIVNLTASDGTNLKATYFAAAKPGPGVLLLHQCNRQRKVWDALAERLAGRGINVLTLDFRGFGESGGTSFNQLRPEQQSQITIGKWPGDIDTAFQYLVSQPGVTRDVIGLGGASCGVDQAIQLARRHPEVKSLALLSGGTDHDGREFLRKPGSLPILIAVADDDPVPSVVEINEWLFALGSNPGNKFAHYSVGGHGVEIFAANKELPGMIVDWFETTLVKTPGIAPVSGASSAASRSTNILEVIDQPGGASKAAKLLAHARSQNPNAVLFSEGLVNYLGYEHLRASDAKGAIEIFNLNVTGYPNSPNVYDSLADAYLADGQKELALQNAKKALELLASDTTDPADRRNAIRTDAEQKVKQLESPPQ